LKPAVLLLDEPLGALDAKLRRQLQVELKALQEQVGITFIYVTHDQEEAITMSDQIAVMNGGHVEQTARPRTLYEEPATAFVAEFLGVSNLMEAQATGPSGQGVALQLGSGITVEAHRGDVAARGAARVVIRPERVKIEPAGATGTNRIPATVTRSVYLGNGVRVIMHLATGQTIAAVVPITDENAALSWDPGAPVTCHLPPAAMHVLRVHASEPAVAVPIAAT
jgi:spermidine/putrescine transport system ATP-binding protein